MRNGKSNDAAFGSRMTGKGLFAQIYSRRARLAIERLGLNRVQRTLDTTKFRPPKEDKPQLSLWVDAAHRGMFTIPMLGVLASHTMTFVLL